MLVVIPRGEHLPPVGRIHCHRAAAALELSTCVFPCCCPLDSDRRAPHRLGARGVATRGHGPTAPARAASRTVQRADAAVATTRLRRVAPAKAARPTMPATGGRRRHLPSPVAAASDHVPTRGGQGGYPGGALRPTVRRQRSPTPRVRVEVAQQGWWRRWRSAPPTPPLPRRVGDGNVAPVRTDRVNVCIGATARSCRDWWWRAGTDSRP